MGKETALAAIIRAQHGPFTHRQARVAGFSASAIKRRVDSGLWLALHRGVLCPVTFPASLARDLSAATLACGGAASHRSAAQWWGVDAPVNDRPDVTVTVSRSRPPGICVHRTTRLSPAEAAPRDGVPVTSPMRTLLDLADLVDSNLLELALDRLLRRRLVDPHRLVGYLDDEWCTHRGGSGALRRLARERCGQGASGSDVETLLLQIIRDAGLPLPVRQHPVATPFGVRYLDLAYVPQRIAIEMDGMDSRLDPRVFLDDRDHQNLIEAQGWTFRRFGYAHVTAQASWTVFTIGQALSLRPVRWR
jgi:hypothetical protein